MRELPISPQSLNHFCFKWSFSGLSCSQFIRQCQPPSMLFPSQIGSHNPEKILAYHCLGNKSNLYRCYAFLELISAFHFSCKTHIVTEKATKFSVLQRHYEVVFLEKHHVETLLLLSCCRILECYRGCCLHPWMSLLIGKRAKSVDG